MMNDARSAYMESSIATASPARLLVMLYERLVADCHRALEAQRNGDHEKAHGQLLHAQEVVIELRGSLNVDVWEGGPGLASLYDYLLTRLIRANVDRDATNTEYCLGLASDLCQTWREAALQTVQVGA